MNKLEILSTAGNYQGQLEILEKIEDILKQPSTNTQKVENIIMFIYNQKCILQKSVIELRGKAGQ